MEISAEEKKEETKEGLAWVRVFQLRGGRGGCNFKYRGQDRLYLRSDI